ncbi:uncharacterized protein LOC143850507 [Tasmannia lanceolata]|uniref:uncharacterized protein LOC143850507 n=1 Tax=Tasmannia lanceolata TaxID=3420 RepID=UPI004063CE79
METKARAHKLREFVNDIQEDWNYWENYQNFIKGRVWILWDPVNSKDEVKKHITIWNREVFGLIGITSPIIKKELEEIQMKIVANPNCNSLKEEETNLINEFLKVKLLEENIEAEIKSQLVAVGRLQHKNFHSAIKSRLSSNQIITMKTEEGALTTEPKEIENILNDYFRGLLNTNKRSVKDTPEPLHKLTADEADHLTRPVSTEEIEEAILKEDGEKAPRPDCFNASFFKHFWYLTKHDFVAAIKIFSKVVNCWLR